MYSCLNKVNLGREGESHPCSKCLLVFRAPIPPQFVGLDPSENPCAWSWGPIVHPDSFLGSCHPACLHREGELTTDGSLKQMADVTV